MKKTTIFAFLLLMLISCHATEKVLITHVSWENGNYEFFSINAAIDNPTKIEPEGQYLLKLLDSKGNALYQLKVNKPADINPAPPNTSFEEKVAWYDSKSFSGSMVLFIPMLEDAQTISFERDTNVLATANLSILCNKNNSCEQPENNLSCPSDCDITQTDEYCFAEIDGKCDPDCLEGIDPDCGKQPTTPKRPEQDSNLLLLVVGGAIIIVIILIFFKMRKQ